MVDALRTGLRLPTLRGHVIEFRGAPAAYRGPLPFDPGWCSNALSLIDLGGIAHTHKSYRRIGTGNREAELLRLMADGGRTQQPVGDYTYVDAATGAREPLGVLYRFAEGEGVNVPLRAGIRALWPLLADGVEPGAAVDASQRELVAPLRETGYFLRDFHRELAERLGPHPEFPAEAVLDETAERLARLTPQILADTRYPVTVREAAATGLSRELTRTAGPRRGPGPPVPATAICICPMCCAVNAPTAAGSCV